MFYAKMHPRGFANEFDVWAFDKKADRDAYVRQMNRTDGRMNRTCQPLPRSKVRRYLTGHKFGGGVNVYPGSRDPEMDTAWHGTAISLMVEERMRGTFPRGAAEDPVRI